MTTSLDRQDLGVRVQTAVDAEIAVQTGVLAQVGDELLPLIDAVASLLRGGKRLRAAFLYWGYRACGGPDSPALIRTATAMEFFQAAALLHDDVMDDSDSRRGMPSAHRRLAAFHAAHGWSGSSDRFGVAGAILGGDLCLTWTDELFATSGLPSHELARARPFFDTMRTHLMGGQFLDVLESARGWEGESTQARVERARRVIRYKSAKYTVEHPLLIGASAAGAAATDLAGLSCYGLAAGEAFQMRDDVLGVFGDPAQTGKPAGDDLREGKRTVLLAYALDTAGAAELAAYDKLLGWADIDPTSMDELRAMIGSSGAVARVEALIEQQSQMARDALRTVHGMTDEGRDMLERLVDLCSARTS